MEELAELQKALIKWMNRDGDPEDVFFETADVEIMLGQIKTIFNNCSNRIEEIKAVKYEDLNNKLKRKMQTHPLGEHELPKKTGVKKWLKKIL